MLSERLLQRTFILTSLVLLNGCEQTISQTTHVPAPNVTVVVQTPVASPSVTSSTIPSTVPASSGPDARVSPVPVASASLPILDLSTPITGPSGPPLIPAELEKFQNSIPLPESTRTYGSQNIEVAKFYWQKRYQKQRQNPYEVLKMYLDAALIAWYNESLASNLNLEVLYTKAPLLFPNYLLQDAQAIAKAKEYAIRSYFRGTSSLNQYLLPDFDNRTVNLVNKNSRGEYIELSPQDALRQAPDTPQEGDSFKYHLYSSASHSDVELTLIYHENGWKIDFWTPNILVAFMP